MPEPQLCVTVTGRTAEAIRHAREAAEPDADLVELRLDSMERPDVEAALAGRRKPAIVTCRPTREGGAFAGSEEERLRILRDAVEHGAEYVDVEWDAAAESLVATRGGRGIIRSRHVFGATPPDPARLLRSLRGGAEFVKLAVGVERIADVLTLLDGAPTDATSILIGMGDAGIATRVLPERFGSRWTYAGRGIAPGQLTASRLLQEFRYRRIRADTAIYGVIGRPVAHSLSPAMHNAGFAALGLNAAYVPFETTDLERLRDFTRAIGLRGLSVTIPFKEAILPLLDEAAPTVAAAGAVNTIAIRDGKWVGLNTDADGFLEPLLRRLPSLANVRALVLGAGGAARAVGLVLRTAGAHVRIAARRPDAARLVAEGVGAESAEWPARGSWDLLVNATPVGSRAVPGMPYDGRFDGGLVYDLVYDPEPTELMRAADRAGCRVVGGIEMLVAQAERQFQIWTGQRPPEGLFAAAAARAQDVRML